MNVANNWSLKVSAHIDGKTARSWNSIRHHNYNVDNNMKIRRPPFDSDEGGTGIFF